MSERNSQSTAMRTNFDVSRIALRSTIALIRSSWSGRSRMFTILFAICSSRFASVPAFLPSHREKGKKRGKKHEGKVRHANTARLEEKMKRKKRKRRHHGRDVAKVIDTVEQAVSTAKKVYRVIE